MKLLVDQDVYAVTIRFLKSLGHDVVTAAEIGGSQAEDIYLLNLGAEKKTAYSSHGTEISAALCLCKGYPPASSICAFSPLRCKLSTRN